MTLRDLAIPEENRRVRARYGKKMFIRSSWLDYDLGHLMALKGAQVNRVKQLISLKSVNFLESLSICFKFKPAVAFRC